MIDATDRAPRFSVVIPTFNRREYVVDALESVFKQTFGEYEVIVIDDGSTDGTAERLAAYADRIRYIAQPNHGPAAAKNRGIREARAPLIGFLDSDDMWEPETLTEVARAFDEQPEAGLVSIMAREIRADGQRTERIYGKRTHGPWYTTGTLLGGDSGGCSWFFVRREALEKAGPFDVNLRSAEECDLCLRLSFVTRMYALRAPLLLRRRHTHNLSNDMTLNAECWIRLLEKLQRDHADSMSHHPQEFRRALGKERLRLGRELLAAEGHRQQTRRRARSLLASSVKTYPYFPRAYAYMAWAWLAPSLFRHWRSSELRRRNRRER